ncbi:hypothetical protein L798_14331 [Zootermopsis nevadensis]|uniref:Uncharacterized protein n=1 Tax=Zootermopsis nevadensis TaxID=136037 RepID=A0A067QMX7_ZOONE|nr:hypothetical protein L798_14331 [Zootermopsis nevadensis]
MSQMKQCIVVLAVIMAVASASGCSSPLNCTGVFHCPLIPVVPGSLIQSGEKYCSCCPVVIIKLGENDVCTNEVEPPIVRLCEEPLVCNGTCIPST